MKCGINTLSETISLLLFNSETLFQINNPTECITVKLIDLFNPLCNTRTNFYLSSLCASYIYGVVFSEDISS